MKIVHGKISAKYSGRGKSTLAAYDRIALYKDDGSISIHNNVGYKPLNYMMAPTVLEETLEEGLLTWSFTGKNETLEITFHEVFQVFDLDIGSEDPGLERESTESHIQKWLLENLEVIGPNLTLVKDEYQTGSGPVDLLLERNDGALVPVEIKRVAPMNTVGQILRYVDGLEEKFPDLPVLGVIAALEFKASTLEIARKKNIQCVTIPGDWKDTGPAKVKAATTLFDIIKAPETKEVSA